MTGEGGFWELSVEILEGHSFNYSKKQEKSKVLVW